MRSVVLVVLPLLAASLGWLAGCERPSSVVDAPDAPASPQASALPAPLAAPIATPSATPAAALLTDSGPPPVPLRGEVALSADLARETVGYTLSAVLHAPDAPAPPRAPEVNAAGIDAARKKTELRLAIDLAPSRMRVALSGTGFVLPPETEIRARSDHYGHVVVWPGGATYRPLPAGATRALLGERRFDVAPIAPAEVTPKDDAGKRIGIRTRKVEVATRAAKASFEVGRLAELGEGGVLLCRLLLDLMSAPPQTPLCGLDELPLRAELRWTSKGSLAFEVTGVLKKNDLAASTLAVPPPNAAFANGPGGASGISPMLTPPELAAFRTSTVDVPNVPAAVTALSTPDGVFVANATDELRVLSVDGVPVLWAAPGARDVLKGLPRGRYVAQWRTFLGDAIEPPFALTVPGIAQLGGADAGVR